MNNAFVFVRLPGRGDVPRIINFSQIAHISPLRDAYTGTIIADQTEIVMCNGDILTVLLPFAAVERQLIELAAYLYEQARQKDVTTTTVVSPDVSQSK